MPKRIARWNPARDAWETETTGLFCEHSDVYSETWPTSGTTRDGTAYELPMSGHLTDDSASSSLLQTPSVADALGGHLTRGGARSDELLLPGQVQALLPTPAAMNPNDGESVETWEARRQRVMLTADNGNGFGTPLAIAVQLLPTPRTSDTNGAGAHGTGGPDLRTAIDLLPTPRATDGTKGGPNQRGSSGDLMLPSAVQSLLPTPRAGSSRTSRHAATAAYRRSAPSLEQVTEIVQGIMPRELQDWDEAQRSWSIGAPTDPLSDDGEPSSDAPPRHLRSPVLEADSA